MEARIGVEAEDAQLTEIEGLILEMQSCDPSAWDKPSLKKYGTLNRRWGDFRASIEGEGIYPSVANYILDQRSDLVDELIHMSAIETLAVDHASFEKIIFLLSSLDRHRAAFYENAYNVRKVAEKRFPEALKSYYAFFNWNR